MSNQTKSSYGLKLSKNAGKSKPSTLPKRKAIFGGDDDGSDDDATSNGRRPDEPVEEKISELGDAFFSTAVPLSSQREQRKRPAAEGKGPRNKNNPLQPPAHPPSSRQKSSSDRFEGDLSTTLTARKYADEAKALDPSIYDYDASYDAFKAVSRKKVQHENGDGDGDGGRKPQYMSNVRKMAELRERDRRMAEDKKMQRERAAEGELFADKEKFVTEAYKQQQEENRRLEEEERRREEEEERKAAARGGGMTGFYKQLLDRDEQQQAAIQEALKQGLTGQTGLNDNNDDVDDNDVEGASAARAREINAHGGDIAVNDEGEVVDKRQLLRGGLNVSSRKRAEIQREKERNSRISRNSERDGGRSDGGRGQAYFAGSKQAMRDRQSRMLEAQYEQVLKRTRDEEEEQVKAVQETAKTRKTAADISSAKERYLARKRAEAEAKKLEQGEGGEIKNVKG